MLKSYSNPPRLPPTVSHNPVIFVRIIIMTIPDELNDMINVCVI